MSPVLPFDIFTLIIDIAGESDDTDLLKVLALVSHSFLQICSKHIFATIDLKVATWSSSKRGFVKLLESRPDVIKYIRKLTYDLGDDDDLMATRYDRSFDDEGFLLIHPSKLPTINSSSQLPQNHRPKIKIIALE